MAKTKAPFARFVVRDGSGLLLGKSFGSLLQDGVVYQIEEIMGELIIKEVGPSALNAPSSVDHCSWNSDADDIIENGHHLHTKDEFKALRKGI